ncbi:response regulator transcription factor [Patiriisocius hiemis]|uniref:Response regulator transcription factor n=1 Tax=Patiriisocius hiemis TaxID=3075604 RepID=A0ABU2YBN3_9FLAO|nr:response regulator transcription factor [Constantimarinum sp. W242]MDT0555281.1 response regulator transcription factor [Constantimarinum sp. W242]
MSVINILVVEDDPIIAEDIKEALTNVNYNVVGLAYNKIDALSFLKSLTPDIVLIDINLGDNLDGILIAETINSEYEIPFLYLTSYSNKEILDKVKHTLPMGYIVKPFEEADLFAAIEIAVSNFYKFNKTDSLQIELINKSIPNKLTMKEFDVLKDIYQGKTSNQIADDHFVSINTIKTHIKNIYEKLDVHSRSEAIVKTRKLLSY